MKILFVFKYPSVDDPRATHQGLGITALNNVMALRELRMEADTFPIPNGEYLWAQLEVPWASYTHIILQAPFIDAPFLKKLFVRFPEKKFALVYHSNLGFLSQDGFAGGSIPAFLQLQDECPNFVFASNCFEFSNAITHGSDAMVTCLPNMYHLPAKPSRQRSLWKPGQTLNIGLFGAARVLKNWLTAGAASMIISKTLGTNVRLYVSTGRDESAAMTRPNLSALLSLNERVQLVEKPWITHDDFMRFLYGMDLLMQPSFTESFNNVTADGCAIGIPSVVSEAIGWVPKDWTAKGDSATSVANVGMSLLKDPQAGLRGWEALMAYNNNSVNAWSHWLNRFV